MNPDHRELAEREGWIWTSQRSVTVQCERNALPQTGVASVGPVQIIDPLVKPLLPISLFTLIV